jgi:hypothetical protein
MNTRRFVVFWLVLAALIVLLKSAEPQSNKTEKRLLYLASPGIRNYVEYGGVGILVFDIDNAHKFVKRIPTWNVPAGQPAENVKGIAASAVTGKIYVSTTKRMACFDLLTDKMVWERTYEGGCDRMAISPDGRALFVPTLEGPYWHIVDGATGDVIAKIETNSGAHNTIFGSDGSRAYLAGLKSQLLSVADAKTHRVMKTVGPFGNVIRPFTVNRSQTLCFVNVNELLGFEVGDLKTGKMLHRVEVSGFEKGPTKRHGCPSHGIGLTPDERELWLCDAHNQLLHIFDATVTPPKQLTSIKLRDQPGWITFSIDGRYAYSSTGEVIDVKTRRILIGLSDEAGRQVHSEKLLEVDFANGVPVRTGDQFGVGRRR